MFALLLLSNPAVYAGTVHLVSTSYTPHYGPDLPQEGPAVEIVRRALAESGYILKIDYMPFARALHEAERGRYAGVMGVWYVEDRNEMLIAGRTDIVAADVANGLYQLTEYFPQQSDEIEWLRPPAELRPLYVVFSRAHPQALEFRDALDKGLGILRAKQEVEIILEQHLGELASDIVALH
ncbi:hypothetical protein [Aliidiomarina celeris]|uniref:hypothetical protein n=1 Tax=Aliidiomarina celeris TaxID=2249428 RepID=UPI0018E63052|nr:hypothetical protein [Aliidiomarina celeris]